MSTIDLAAVRRSIESLTVGPEERAQLLELCREHENFGAQIRGYRREIDLITRQRLQGQERERALRDMLDIICEWVFDRASRLGAVGLYPDEWDGDAQALLGPARPEEPEGEGR